MIFHVVLLNVEMNRVNMPENREHLHNNFFLNFGIDICCNLVINNLGAEGGAVHSSGLPCE